eukprot:COSAG01_NODE_8588_length_2728_cov_2.749912_2_plen_208_part_00
MDWPRRLNNDGWLSAAAATAGQAGDAAGGGRRGTRRRGGGGSGSERRGHHARRRCARFNDAPCPPFTSHGAAAMVVDCPNSCAPDGPSLCLARRETGALGVWALATARTAQLHPPRRRRCGGAAGLAAEPYEYRAADHPAAKGCGRGAHGESRGGRRRRRRRGCRGRGGERRRLRWRRWRQLPPLRELDAGDGGGGARATHRHSGMG